MHACCSLLYIYTSVTYRVCILTFFSCLHIIVNSHTNNKQQRPICLGSQKCLCHTGNKSWSRTFVVRVSTCTIIWEVYMCVYHHYTLMHVFSNCPNGFFLFKNIVFFRERDKCGEVNKTHTVWFISLFLETKKEVIFTWRWNRKKFCSRSWYVMSQLPISLQ